MTEKPKTFENPQVDLKANKLQLTMEEQDRVIKAREKREANIRPKFKMVNELRKRFKDMISITKTLYNKVDNVYVKSESEIRKELTNLLEEYNFSTSSDSIIKHLIDNTSVDEDKFFCHDLWIIPFKNGYYDIKNEKFITEENKNFFYEVPHNYDGLDNKCPEFTKGVHKWLSYQKNTNELTVDDIFEIIGYCMTMNTNLKKAFYFFGPTHTGKTTLQDILLHVVGDSNTAGIPLQRMSQRFGTDGLQLKILNTVAEMSSKELNDLSIFKGIVGGDKYIFVEIKGIPGSQTSKCLNHIKLLFLGNRLPFITDILDDAFFNKWILINFACQFPVLAEPWSDFIINNPEEIKGIISRSIKAVNELYKRGGFRPDITENNEHIWNFHSDGVYRFIHSQCIMDDESKVAKTKLINAYIDYIVENKLGKVLGNTKFATVLRNMGHRLTKSNDRRFFKGLKLKTLDDFHPELNYPEEPEREDPYQEETSKESYQEYIERVHEKRLAEAYLGDNAPEQLDPYDNQLIETWVGMKDPTPHQQEQPEEYYDEAYHQHEPDNKSAEELMYNENVKKYGEQDNEDI